MRLTPSLVASLVAIAAAVPTATAADGPWSGAHAGFDLGYGQYTASITDVDYDYYGSTMSLTDNNVVMGLRGGYDMQFGALVVGADFTWISTKAESTERFDNDVNIKNSVDSVMALRLRGGMAVENSLIYLVGGLAQGNFAHTWDDDGAPNDSIPNVDNDEMGTVLGIGLETLVADMIAVRGEMARYDFPSVSDKTPNGSLYRFADELVTFTIGASYRF